MMRMAVRNSGGSPGSNSAWLDLDRAEKVPEILARKILREIVQTDMAPGSRLPSESVMLARFGVGRASLREALRILETHGLVRIKPGPQGGPVVTEMTASDYGKTTTLYLHRAKATFGELVEARLVIEPVMARMAAERLTDELAERLREATILGWDSVEANPDVWSNCSEAFHSVVAGASGNRVLDLYSMALVAIERHRLAPLFTDLDDRKRTLRVHDRIAKAVLNGDADQAEHLTRRHMQALAKTWRANYANQMAGVVEWR
jgi:GntR family transcriptional regulator, transcriptional repressor for pyruvate dehydrogenase complex